MDTTAPQCGGSAGSDHVRCCAEVPRPKKGNTVCGSELRQKQMHALQYGNNGNYLFGPADRCGRAIHAYTNPDPVSETILSTLRNGIV